MKRGKVPSGVTVEDVVRGCEPFDGYFVAAQMDIDVGALQLFYPRPPVSRNLHKFAQLRRGLVRLGA